MKGSENGTVIIPGDSANSLLVQIQSADHFAISLSKNSTMSSDGLMQARRRNSQV